MPRKSNFTDSQNLTERQQQILRAITEISADRGFPPTIREIGDLVGLTSTSSVAHQLKVLEAKGMISRNAGSPRAVNISAEAAEVSRIAPSNINTAMRELPLLGNIAAGNPITAIESYSDLMAVPEELLEAGNHFLLKVQGDSMIDAAICDGDWVVIKQQNTAVNGDIVAALLDEEATIKTYHRGKDGVWLLPQNSLYPPINGDHANIMGIVTALMRKF